MTAENKSLRDRTNDLIDLADRTLATKETDAGTIPRQRVSNELFAGFRSASLSLILRAVGDAHPYYKEFDLSVRRAAPADVERGRGILKSLKTELDSGFLS